MKEALLIIAGIAVFAVLAIGVGALGPGLLSGHLSESAYKEEQAIVADTTVDDCDVLQVRFDGWYDNRHDFDVGVASSAMDADYDRMDELGCFRD